jgi:hypothetical protein
LQRSSARADWRTRTGPPPAARWRLWRTSSAGARRHAAGVGVALVGRERALATSLRGFLAQRCCVGRPWCVLTHARPPFVRREALPLYGNTHTTTSVTGLQARRVFARVHTPSARTRASPAAAAAARGGRGFGTSLTPRSSLSLRVRARVSPPVRVPARRAPPSSQRRAPWWRAR